MSAKPYSTGVFLFHRDLRIFDNTGLIAALEKCETVLPCFIFEDKQLNNNSYRGDASVAFMIKSLIDLQNRLKEQGGRLHLFAGVTSQVLEQLFDRTKTDAFFTNADHTPFARKRDEVIRQLCEKKSVAFHRSHDALLTVPGQVLKPDGKPYSIYTPFRRKASQLPIAVPQNTTHQNFFGKRLETECNEGYSESLLASVDRPSFIKGARTEGLRLLDKIKDQAHYEEERNIPSIDSTTGLSAHHKFGTVSIRETYQRISDLFGVEHPLIGELYWRDFFTHIAYHYPHVFKGAFRPQYDSISWNTSDADFRKWCEGRTGFPIVDAGMRQLNETGLMHNRVRMITASFLVKDLHIDWRKGEKYFAQKLVDYDPAVNNGNWQWAASTGCDAQPYFRIFNPWTQQKRFDPNCTYIKEWVEELRNIDAKSILNEKLSRGPEYPSAMVDHSQQAAIAKMLFKQA